MSHKTGPIGRLELGGMVVTAQRLETGADWSRVNAEQLGVGQEKETVAGPMQWASCQLQPRVRATPSLLPI